MKTGGRQTSNVMGLSLGTRFTILLRIIRNTVRGSSKTRCMDPWKHEAGTNGNTLRGHGITLRAPVETRCWYKLRVPFRHTAGVPKNAGKSHETLSGYQNKGENCKNTRRSKKLAFSDLSVLQIAACTRPELEIAEGNLMSEFKPFLVLFLCANKKRVVCFLSPSVLVSACLSLESPRPV